MVKLGTFFNRINLAAVLIPSCLLIGCNDNSLREPALKTAALVGSADASAELLEEATGNVFALTINGAKISSDFTSEQITSVCALAFSLKLRPHYHDV